MTIYLCVTRGKKAILQELEYPSSRILFIPFAIIDTFNLDSISRIMQFQLVEIKGY
jgi:hypothetical protein